MAQRLYNLNDAPTRPVLWGDVQDAPTVTYDATTKRISAIANKGTAGGVAFAPPAVGNAPLFNATGFLGTYPGATFNSNEPDYLLSTAASQQQPTTVIYVWQQGTAMKAYEVFADHDTNVSGSRQTIFSAYGGTTPIYIIRTVSGAETQVNIGGGNEAANRVNILIVEYNGTSSRIYLNGVTTTGINLGTVLSNAGLAIGGKKGDSATYFGGIMGEVAEIPAVFGAGDAWDRVTQGTSWKWGQQASIPAGATYKTAAPMVDAASGGAAPDTAAQAQAAASPALVSHAATQPASASHAQASASPTLGSRAAAQPDTGQQPQVAASPALTVKGLLQPDSAAQGHGSASPALSARSIAAPDSSSQPQASTSPSLAPSQGIVPAAALQTQASTAPTIAARGVITPDSGTQAQAAAQPALSGVRSATVPASAAQGQAASQAALLASGLINAAGAAQTQASTAPTVAVRSAVTPMAATNAQAASGASLSVRPVVAPTTSVQIQLASTPVLITHGSVAANDVNQPQSATSPALFVGKRPLPPPTRVVRSPRVIRIASRLHPSRLAA